MPQSLPTILVPGLNCSPRLYAPQVPALWRFGPVTVADHTRDETMAAIAKRILDDAPPRFALAGLSMGGYIALEVMRQAPSRVAKLALLDTGSRADPPEAQERRRTNIAAAEAGRFDEIIDAQFPLYVHPGRANDAALKSVYLAMCHDVGAQAYVRQQKAIMGRADSRPLLPSIRCPTLVLVGAQDEATPPALSEEMAAAISAARLVVVPDCGHLSTLEQPEAVTRALIEWMNS
ncbi:MAG: alpha/beta fold hydrolase [Alphaproteobacteria bacterium]|nr:MAG: alpha/beta fold hydrolase [Alphaproteobacteria bacterium]